MARTKRSRRSYGAGEWGRNRVRVFPDPKTGLFQMEWRENRRRLTRSLGHRDWARAKRQADEFLLHKPQKPAPPRQSRAGPPAMDDGPALREVSNAQIVQSINREESNDGTHETKPALLWCRRVGPEPGPGVPRPENRSVPDGVAREPAQAHPVARTPRLGAREEAGGRVPPPQTAETSAPGARPRQSRAGPPAFQTRRSCSPSIERNRTMARTKRSRRSYGAGEWGRNRVRVFPDPKTGLFQMEWRENRRRLTRSLGHRDWARAKRQADEFLLHKPQKPAPPGRARARVGPDRQLSLFQYGDEPEPGKVREVRPEPGAGGS